MTTIRCRAGSSAIGPLAALSPAINFGSFLAGARSATPKSVTT
jgi:hypothetical protein